MNLDLNDSNLDLNVLVWTGTNGSEQTIAKAPTLLLFCFICLSASLMKVPYSWDLGTLTADLSVCECCKNLASEIMLKLDQHLNTRLCVANILTN